MTLTVAVNDPKIIWTMDDVINKLGMGLWTYLIFAAEGLNMMSMSVTLIGAEFSAPTVSFTCEDSLLYDDVDSIDGTECFVLHNNGSDDAATKPCQNFLFDNSTFSSTIGTQFELVCSKSHMLPLVQLIGTVGTIFGSLIGGVLAEKFGRMSTLWYSILFYLVSIVLLVTSPVYWGVLLARFLLGTLTMVSLNAAFTLGMEVCPSSFRATYGIFSALPYALMMIIIAGIAYGIRDWKLMTIICYIPEFLMVIPGNPFAISESPRWLVSRGRLEQAEVVLRKAAKMNGTTKDLPENLGVILNEIYRKDEESVGVKPTMKQRLRSMVSTSAMRNLTFVNVLLWFVLGAVYMYIPLTADTLSNSFLFMAVLGVAETPAYSLSAPITEKFGRRWVINGSLLLGAVFLFVDIGFEITNVETDWLRILCSALAYTCFCTAWQVAETFRSELFPTSVRTLSGAVAYSIGSVGWNVPPLVFMFTEDLPKSLQWVNSALYAVLALCIPGLVMMLPETNNKPLMETVEEYVQSTKVKKENKKRKCGTEEIGNSI